MAGGKATEWTSEDGTVLSIKRLGSDLVVVWMPP